MKSFFSKLLKEVLGSITRFFVTFFFSVLLFCVSVYNMFADSPLDGAVVLTLFFGIFFCTLGKLLLERYGERLRHWWVFFELLFVLIGAAVYLLLTLYQENAYCFAGYFGVMLALFASILYVADIGNISKTISHLIKNTAFNLLICSIVSAGSMLSIAAFSLLVYRFDNDYKIYLISVLFIWIVLFGNLTLVAIPKKDVELAIPRLFKVIVLYAALPVYLLLLTILYVYLGKILLTFSFPSGQVNLFASFATVLFVFFTFALAQYKDENKIARFFVRFGGYFMLPIMAMQFVAVFIRLSNYGLTSWRYISLVLNILGLAFVVVSLIKNGRWLKQLFLAVCCAALLVTLTPLNLYDVPFRNQVARLTKVLRVNDMIMDGKITANSDISTADKIAITSAYEYIDDNSGKDRNLPVTLEHIDVYKLSPSVFERPNNETFQLIFGFPKTYEQSDIYRSYEPSEPSAVYGNYRNRYAVLDVAGYARVYKVASFHNDDGTFRYFENSERVFTFDITSAIRALYATYGSASSEVLMEFPVDDNKLILTYVSFSIDSAGVLTVSNFDGYFLEK